MWWNEYDDKGLDEPLKEATVDAGKSIPGCEMKETCGWGTRVHNYRRPSSGILRQLASALLGMRFEK